MRFNLAVKEHAGELVTSIPVGPKKAVKGKNMKDLENEATRMIYGYLGRSLDEMINAETESPEITLWQEK